tara:strand:- start:835 stop:1110 length:276 start_codon:yes stop_codon:yes gene_type:complete
MLFRNLLVYRRKRLYKVAKHRRDSNLNTKFDYKTGERSLIKRVMSPHILRNQTMREFTVFINDFMLNLLDQVRYLKGYKNFTIEKDDDRTR